MSALAFCQWLVLAAFLTHRVLVLQLSAFHEALIKAPWTNATTGLASDMAGAAAFCAVLEGMKVLARRRGWALPMNLAGAALATLATVLTMTHLRYVEFFGMSFDPMHAYLLRTPSGAGDGAFIVLSSWRVQVEAAVVAVVGAAIWWVVRRRSAPPLSLRAAGMRTVGLVVVAAALHSATLRLRWVKDLHPELTYSPLSSLYLKSRALARAAVVPPEQSLLFLRDGFDPSRPWADATGRYPFWQTRVPTSETLTPELANIRADAQAFFAREAAKKGPWNVVVIFLESMRADVVEGFADPGEFVPGLVPSFSAAYASGIRFTETYTNLNMTHHGQTSVQCGLFSMPRMALMVDAPRIPAFCLPDWARASGRDTWYFMGGDGRFDRQAEFYQAHRTRHVVTRDDFPADAPEGNWGVGDATLFSLAAERLKASRKPFYASILTASNHWPFTLPEDAPETIGRSQPMRLQLLQYVDFAFGKFWEAVARDFPHTLVVVVADHGVHYPDEPTPTAEIPFDVFRKHYRVPLLIAAPGLPAGVAGGVVSTPASQADIAPTVMTLLGETEWDNHFMGYDAFARREPIFFYWERTWRRLTWPRGFASAPTIDEQMVTATTYPFWEALVKQKRLMPKGRLGTHLQVRDK